MRSSLLRVSADVNQNLAIPSRFKGHVRSGFIQPRKAIRWMCGWIRGATPEVNAKYKKDNIRGAGHALNARTERRRVEHA